MAQPGRKALSCKSSVSFGIHSESKKILEMRKIRFQNRRFSVLVAAAIFVLFLILISLLVFDILNSSKASKNSISKRFIHLDEPENLDDIHPLQQTALNNETSQDVLLVPENTETTTIKRMDEHPNHRYREINSKDEIIDRMMKNLYTESGWSPQPFQIKPEAKARTSSLNNIQDIIRQVEASEDSRVPVQNVDAFQQYNGLSKPIRFKGIYVRPKTEEKEESTDEEENNRNYLHQINQLLNINPTDPTDATDIPTSVGQGFTKPYNGPDLLPNREGSGLSSFTKAIYHPYDMKVPPTELKKAWTKRNQEVVKKPKKKPITVMLDIYPMTKGEDAEEPTTQKPKKEMIYIPIRPGEEFFEPFATNPTKNIALNLMPPNQRRIVAGPNKNRMIMKLNLYPRNREMKRKRGGIYNPHTDTRIGEVIYPKKQTADRRTFGLFSHFKKKLFHHNDCDLIGHNPYGKPISAKWKDEDGDWVHAKYVALKEWDDDGGWGWFKKHKDWDE